MTSTPVTALGAGGKILLMGRLLFTSLSAVSLALCLAWTGLGFTRVHNKGIAYKSGTRAVRIFLEAGHSITIGWSDLPADRYIPQGWSRIIDTIAEYNGAGVPTHQQSRYFGIQVESLTFASGFYLYWINIPYRMPWLLTAALPALYVTYRWRSAARRRALGLCLTCGYDLRASRERCPECGAPVPGANSGTSA